MSTLGLTIRAGLVVPLLLVAVLAGAVGYSLGRAVYPRQDVPGVSTVATTAATPSPAPTPTATSSPESASGGTSRSSDSSCPAGCECRHPPGGIVIVCHGGTAVRVP